MRILVFPILFILLVAPIVSGQERIRLVKVPVEVVPVLVMQQDCPLRIESAEFLLRENAPGSLISYRVRNISSKSVRSLVVSSVSIGGGGSTWSLTLDDQRLLAPKRTLSSLRNSDYEVIPFGEKSAESPNSSALLKAVWIVMVEEVVFADGSRFNAKNLSKSLQTFLDESVK